MNAQLAAKDDLVKLKQAEIDSLQQLTPMKLKEYVTSATSLLEEYIDKLKSELEQAKIETSKKEEQIKIILTHKMPDEAKVAELQQGAAKAQQKVAQIQTEIMSAETIRNQARHMPSTKTKILLGLTGLLAGGNPLLFLGLDKLHGDGSSQDSDVSKS